MKLIIAGSRDIEGVDEEVLSRWLFLAGFPPVAVSEVVSGGARGIDTLGEEWASYFGIPVKRFPAQWNRYGKIAGKLRNRQMAEYVKEHNGALFAVWDGMSPGTAHMIAIATALGLRVHVRLVEGDEDERGDRR